LNTKILEKVEEIERNLGGRLSKIEKSLKDKDTESTSSINIDEKTIRMVIILVNLRYMNFATFYKLINLSNLKSKINQIRAL